MSREDAKKLLGGYATGTLNDAERQALALMDHPNIARVLDAGATETRFLGRIPGGYFLGVEIARFVVVNGATWPRYPQAAGLKSTGSGIARYTVLHNCAAFDSSASLPLAPKAATW